MSTRRLTKSIEAIKLKWHDNVSLSNQHEDYYFSLKKELQETRYILLAQIRLSQRWLKQATKVGHKPFTIVDTGLRVAQRGLFDAESSPKRAKNWVVSVT